MGGLTGPSSLACSGAVYSEELEYQQKDGELWLFDLWFWARRSFGSPSRGSGATKVTYNKDVLPILEKNCQSCHRPGEIGPMPFLTYEGVRPWAKAIKEAVLTRKMPPWFADPRYGHFMKIGVCRKPRSIPWPPGWSGRAGRGRER